jgi:hypothetical protein
MINARIGIRVLAENHLALHEPSDPEWIGIVNKTFSPAKLITRVGNHVREICNVNYGSSPAFVLTGDVDTKFPYIVFHSLNSLAEPCRVYHPRSHEKCNACYC